MIAITDSARKQLQRMGVNHKQFLRICTDGLSCLDTHYNAFIDDTIKDDDSIVWDDEDIMIIAELGSALQLDGSRIDVSHEGFAIHIPEEKVQQPLAVNPLTSR